MRITITVNGKKYKRDVAPSLRLIDFLRDDLGLTGVKEGCGEGECGACTVLMDNKAVHSCLVLALQADGSDITTIEGLGTSGGLDPLQDAFIETGAVQCGFCTPGMIMTAKALLLEKPHPNEEEIKAAIAGNLCRCTGYNKIVKAIKTASQH